MPLNIDTSQGLRSPRELLTLVEAVHLGADEDETNWVEWKSTLDLTKAEGAFSVARGVIGFANRDPDRVAVFMEGLAYFVVGVASGRVDGVARLDPAKVDDALRLYLGDTGPKWGVDFLEYQGRVVMIVTVEAPRWGDPIHTLAKDYFGPKGATPGAADGTVFIRRQAKTVQASSDEQRMLQDRLTRGSRVEQSLDLVVEWPDDPARLVAVDLSDEALDEWVEKRRQAILAMRPEEPPSETGSSKIAQALVAALTSDPRSRDAYLEEVEVHLASCRKALVHAVVAEATSQRLNVVTLRVSNPSARNLPATEVTVTMEARGVAFEEDNEHEYELPEPPRPLGAPRESSLFLKDTFLSRDVSFLSRLASTPVPVINTRIAIDNGPPMVIVLDLGDLRPHEVVAAEPFILVVNEPLESEILARWTATSKGIDALQQGVLILPMASRVLRPVEVVPYDA